MSLRLTMAFGLLLLVLHGVANAGPFSDLFVLGDSQSDSGNVASLTPNRAVPPYQPVPPAPYPSDRLTNGPVWAEYLADAIGKSASPSATGGTNYAFATARLEGYGPNPVPTLLDQATALLANLGGSLPRTALFAVWGGANDIGDVLSTGVGQNIPDAISALDTIVRDLAAAGAEHFLIPNVGDLGVTPLFSSVSQTATALTVQFNTMLMATLDQIVLDLPHLNLTRFDMFALSRDVVGNPSTYGFTDATAPCLSFGDPNPATAVCNNPDEYVFWDALHFTTAAHAVLGQAVYEAVPAPAPILLVAAGLFGIAGTWRPRRADTTARITTA